MKQDIYLSSKPRYEILDGLRGVAALLVVCYHLCETYFGNGPRQLVGHGYLAVDFFFVLSGFVIGYAYDDRWNKMSILGFFKRRLIRLHPMVIIGSIIGALLFYFGAAPSMASVAQTPWWMVLLILLWTFTMIPIPTGFCDIRGWGETNPLNGPAWTLQLEYFANILYALFIRKLSNNALRMCVGVFAVLTIILCLNIDITGFLSRRSEAAYTVVGGWSLTPEQLQIAFTRLLYPFFCGLLISRTGRLLKVKNGFWWCAVLVALVLMVPQLGLDGHRWINGVYEAFCLLLVFPLIVSMGAGSSVKGSRTSAINKFLGDISYPLYITHYPLVYIQVAWSSAHPDAPLYMHIMVSVSIFIIAILVACSAFKLYDLPVRAWLKSKLFRSPSSESN